MRRIIKSRKRAWHERINKCFERYADECGRSDRKVKMSQSELVRRIRARYEDMSSIPDVSQTSISRWLSVGGEGAPDANLPPTETIIMLADFFEVDVGYLLGETDYRTFTIADAVKYLGLNREAIEHVRLATRFETAFHNVHMLPEEAGETISSFLASKKFFDLVMAFEEMNRVYNGPDMQKRLFKELEEKYGSEMLAEALEFDPQEHEGEEVDPVFREAYIEVQESLDKMYAAKNDREAYEGKARYELIKAFEEVVKELYPE